MNTIAIENGEKCQHGNAITLNQQTSLNQVYQYISILTRTNMNTYLQGYYSMITICQMVQCDYVIHHSALLRCSW